MTILVCDDDKEIVEAIEIYLMQEGYNVEKAYDGQEALKIVKDKKIDLMIIDVMMPKLDGIRATLQIRKESKIPIIILSAKTEDADKILGLNVGADDYVTKPFNPLELVARVKSQLRRYTTLSSYGDEEGNVYEVGGLLINDDLKKVFCEVLKLIVQGNKKTFKLEISQDYTKELFKDVFTEYIKIINEEINKIKYE